MAIEVGLLHRLVSPFQFAFSSPASLSRFSFLLASYIELLVLHESYTRNAVR